MSKKTKAAERHFGESLRGRQGGEYKPPVETSLTRIDRQKRMNQFGWIVLLVMLGAIPVVAFLECMRVV